MIASPTNEGFAAGNNRGFSYAIENQFTYAMMLNNDVFVEPDFISKLIQYMETHQDTGAIQPKIFFNHDRKKCGMGALIFYSGLVGATQNVTLEGQEYCKANFSR